MPKKPTKPTTRLGRPPAGIGGASVAGYRRMTVYVDPAASAAIERIARETQQPRWRVIHDAVMSYAPRKRR